MDLNGPCWSWRQVYGMSSFEQLENGMYEIHILLVKWSVIPLVQQSGRELPSSLLCKRVDQCLCLVLGSVRTVGSCLHRPQHSEMEEATEREGGAGEALRGGGEAAPQAAAGGDAGIGAAAAGGVQYQEGEPAGATQAAAGTSQTGASGSGQSPPPAFEE